KDAAEALSGGFTHMTQWNSLLVGIVGGHHAARARVADEHQPPALRPAARAVELGSRDQLVRIACAPDAVALEEGVHHPILGGERAGMGACRLLPAAGAPGLEGDDRQVALARLFGGSRQDLRILD